MDPTLSGDAQALVRSPHSTVTPRADSTSSAKLHERPPPPIEEEAVLGQGGMGVVRLATQLPLGRKVTGGRQRMRVALGVSVLWVLAPLLGKPAVVRWPGYELLLSAAFSGVSLPAARVPEWRNETIALGNIVLVLNVAVLLRKQYS